MRSPRTFVLKILRISVEEEFDGVFERAVVLAAGGVFVSAAVKDLAAEDVHRPVALAAHRDFYLFLAAVGKLFFNGQTVLLQGQVYLHRPACGCGSQPKKIRKPAGNPSDG